MLLRFKEYSETDLETAATFKPEPFVIIVNGFQPLIIITKSSILDVAAFLDPSLILVLLEDTILAKLLQNQKLTIVYENEYLQEGTLPSSALQNRIEQGKHEVSK